MSTILIDIEDPDGNTVCGLIIKRDLDKTKLKLHNLSLADAFEDTKIHGYRLQIEEKHCDSVIPCI